MALMLFVFRAKLFGSLTLSWRTSKAIVRLCIFFLACSVHCTQSSLTSAVSVLCPPSFQHWWQVWCGLLRQRVNLLRWFDVLAASCYLSQHLCHWDHLLPIWLSKLHASIQVRNNYNHSNKQCTIYNCWFVCFFNFVHEAIMGEMNGEAIWKATTCS